MVTPDTLTALRQLRQGSEAWAKDDLVLGLSMSQISRRVDSMARAWARDTLSTLRGSGDQGDPPRSSAAGGANPRALEVTVDASAVY